MGTPVVELALSRRFGNASHKERPLLAVRWLRPGRLLMNDIVGNAGRKQPARHGPDSLAGH